LLRLLFGALLGKSAPFTPEQRPFFATLPRPAMLGRTLSGSFRALPLRLTTRVRDFGRRTHDEKPIGETSTIEGQGYTRRA
jgi:hypothetical protein